MKNIVIAAILFCTAAVTLSAQEFFLGPYLLGKATVNAGEIQTGTKTGVKFNMPPDFGATAMYKLPGTTNMAVMLDLGYQTLSILSKPESNANDDNTSFTASSYLTIAPSINFSGFLLGLGVNVPMSVSENNLSGTSEVDGSTDNSKTVLELRIGGIIPMVKMENGAGLNFVVIGAYGVGGMTTNLAAALEEFDPKPASLSLGFNYMFNLSK